MTVKWRFLLNCGTALQELKYQMWLNDSGEFSGNLDATDNSVFLSIQR